MTVKFADDGSPGIHVSYCSHHAGHDVELRHLRLSSDIHHQVTALLRQGATVSKVMDRMRDGLGTNLQRDDLLCR